MNEISFKPQLDSGADRTLPVKPGVPSKMHNYQAKFAVIASGMQLGCVLIYAVIVFYYTLGDEKISGGLRTLLFTGFLVAASIALTVCAILAGKTKFTWLILASLTLAVVNMINYVAFLVIVLSSKIFDDSKKSLATLLIQVIIGGVLATLALVHLIALFAMSYYVWKLMCWCRYIERDDTTETTIVSEHGVLHPVYLDKAGYPVVPLELPAHNNKVTRWLGILHLLSTAVLMVLLGTGIGLITEELVKHKTDHYLYPTLELLSLLFTYSICFSVLAFITALVTLGAGNGKDTCLIVSSIVLNIVLVIFSIPTVFHTGVAMKNYGDRSDVDNPVIGIIGAGILGVAALLCLTSLSACSNLIDCLMKTEQVQT